MYIIFFRFTSFRRRWVNCIGFLYIFYWSMSPPPPRSIQGSVGSRIRLIFGATANEWLLILNEDDGDCEFQSRCWSPAMPHAFIKQLHICTSKGRYAKEVDVGPGGAWYINGVKRDGTGSHSWWDDSTLASTQIKEWVAASDSLKVFFGTDRNGAETHLLIQGDNRYWPSENLDSDLVDKLKRIRSNNKKVHFVRLFARGGYFISDSEGTDWKSVGRQAAEEMDGGEKVEEVAVAVSGAWVVIHPNRFAASKGMPSELSKRLARFFRDQGERNSRRSKVIREHHARIATEEEEAERIVRVTAERDRLEREAWDREEQEEAERVKLARKAEDEARQKAEQLAQEIAEQQERERKQKETLSRAVALESMMEDRLSTELSSIQELEKHIQNRKRSLRRSLAILPEDRRSKIEEALDASDAVSIECVICHERRAQQAIIPCGHNCLCDGCALVQALGYSEGQPLCPLCHGPIESTLKILMPE